MDKENKFRREMGYPLRTHYGEKTIEWRQHNVYTNSEFVRKSVTIKIYMVVNGNNTGTHPSYRTNYNEISRKKIIKKGSNDKGKSYISD
jgi:hypothetical protein